MYEVGCHDVLNENIDFEMQLQEDWVAFFGKVFLISVVQSLSTCTFTSNVAIDTEKG